MSVSAASRTIRRPAHPRVKLLASTTMSAVSCLASS